VLELMTDSMLEKWFVKVGIYMYEANESDVLLWMAIQTMMRR
jgi:hypothetical protein